MEEEGLLCTPPEIQELAEATAQSLLPEKSETAYKKQFQKFEDWRQENNIQTVSENVLLAYFEVQRQKYKPSTLWTVYSMLRTCLTINVNIDISKYSKLQALLKRSSQGYIPKKSKILEETDIHKFIREAGDEKYLAMKVCNLHICIYNSVSNNVIYFR
jgi:site-specific recombinase XerD